MSGVELHALYVTRAVRSLGWAVTYEEMAQEMHHPAGERREYVRLARAYRLASARWYTRAAHKTRFLPHGGFDAPDCAPPARPARGRGRAVPGERHYCYG